jgi:hypothetical protein
LSFRALFYQKKVADAKSSRELGLEEGTIHPFVSDFGSFGFGGFGAPGKRFSGN